MVTASFHTDNKIIMREKRNPNGHSTVTEAGDKYRYYDEIQIKNLF